MNHSRLFFSVYDCLCTLFEFRCPSRPMIVLVFWPTLPGLTLIVLLHRQHYWLDSLSLMSHCQRYQLVTHSSFTLHSFTNYYTQENNCKDIYNRYNLNSLTIMIEMTHERMQTNHRWYIYNNCQQHSPLGFLDGVGSLQVDGWSPALTPIPFMIVNVPDSKAVFHWVLSKVWMLQFF